MEHSVVTVMGIRYRAYNDVMTDKRNKAKRRKAGAQSGRVSRLRASIEDDLGLLADEDSGGESRWNRPRRPRISLRVDIKVLDWFKSKGPGYQPRINRILRRFHLTAAQNHTTMLVILDGLAASRPRLPDGTPQFLFSYLAV